MFGEDKDRLETVRRRGTGKIFIFSNTFEALDIDFPNHCFLILDCGENFIQESPVPGAIVDEGALEEGLLVTQFFELFWCDKVVDRIGFAGASEAGRRRPGEVEFRVCLLESLEYDAFPNPRWTND